MRAQAAALRCRRPGRCAVMCPRKRDALQVFAVGVDHVNLAFPVCSRAEYQMPAIRRPGRGIVDSRPCGELDAFLTVRRNQAQLIFFFGCTAHIGDPVAARRPGRGSIIVPFEGEPANVGSIRGHEKHLRTSATVRSKCKLPARGRPGGRKIARSVDGEPLKGLRPGVQPVQFRIALMARGKGQKVAVG